MWRHISTSNFSVAGVEARQITDETRQTEGGSAWPRQRQRVVARADVGIEHVAAGGPHVAPHGRH